MPANMAKALRQLRPKVAKFFPALEEVEPIGVTSGVSLSCFAQPKVSGLFLETNRVKVLLFLLALVSLTVGGDVLPCGYLLYCVPLSMSGQPL